MQGERSRQYFVGAVCLGGGGVSLHNHGGARADRTVPVDRQLEHHRRSLPPSFRFDGDALSARAHTRLGRIFDAHRPICRAQFSLNSHTATSSDFFFVFFLPKFPGSYRVWLSFTVGLVVFKTWFDLFRLNLTRLH